MFVTNNHASFYLYCKKNLVKHQESQNILTMIVDHLLDLAMEV